MWSIVKLQQSSSVTRLFSALIWPIISTFYLSFSLCDAWFAILSTYREWHFKVISFLLSSSLTEVKAKFQNTSSAIKVLFSSSFNSESEREGILTIIFWRKTSSFPAYLLWVSVSNFMYLQLSGSFQIASQKCFTSWSEKFMLRSLHLRRQV